MKKIPNPIDRHVGGRVRRRRILGGISQEKLGESIGVTFRQIQQYENGVNRISAGRLQQIADCLGVTVPFFFENAPSSQSPSAGTATAFAEFLETNDGMRLLTAFEKIKSPRLRGMIINFVYTLAEDRSAADGSTSSPVKPDNT